MSRLTRCALNSALIPLLGKRARTEGGAVLQVLAAYITFWHTDGASTTQQPVREIWLDEFRAEGATQNDREKVRLLWGSTACCQEHSNNEPKLLPHAGRVILYSVVGTGIRFSRN